jgi:hypothetical protein
MPTPTSWGSQVQILPSRQSLLQVRALITSEIGALTAVRRSPNLTRSHDSLVKWSNWSVQVDREVRFRPLQCLTEEEVNGRVDRAAGPSCVRGQPLVDVGIKADRSLPGGWVVVHSQHGIAVSRHDVLTYLVTARPSGAITRAAPTDSASRPCSKSFAVECTYTRYAMLKSL